MDPFIGEVRIFTGNFAPTGWFLCQGQLLPISAYQALFAIIGTFYGGNGTSNFQLPNLQGRFPIGAGMAPSGQIYNIGQIGGVEQISLTINNLPSHSHLATFTPGTGGSSSLMGSPNPANSSSPSGNYIANTTDTSGTLPSPPQSYVTPAAAGTPAALAGLSVTGAPGTVSVQNAGNSLPFAPTPLYVAFNYIIAYNGIFPSRG